MKNCFLSLNIQKTSFCWDYFLSRWTTCNLSWASPWVGEIFYGSMAEWFKCFCSYLVDTTLSRVMKHWLCEVILVTINLTLCITCMHYDIQSCMWLLSLSLLVYMKGACSVTTPSTQEPVRHDVPVFQSGMCVCCCCCCCCYPVKYAFNFSVCVVCMCMHTCMS